MAMANIQQIKKTNKMPTRSEMERAQQIKKHK